MNFEVYGRTDVGRVRKNNEDNFGIAEDLGVCVIADGMGGALSGEVASKMAVDVITDCMRRFIKDGQKAIIGKIDPKVSERGNQLASSVRLSNQFIHESAKSKPQHQGMGTTVDCMLLQKNLLSIGHVGDSRVYLVRSGKLVQLTLDHSYVEEQVRMGMMTHEEADKSPMKHILTRALGPDPDVEVDIYEHEVAKDDILVACTDGLNKMVTDEQILATVLEMKTPKMIAEHLVDLANAGGGVDNTTVIAVQIKK